MTSFYVARPRRLRRQEQIGRSGWPEYPDYPSGDFVTFKITEVTDRKKYPETSTRRKLRIANADVGNVVLLKTNFPDARYFVFAQSFFQMFASKSSMKYLQSSSQLF
jgi:hypothetical protein